MINEDRVQPAPKTPPTGPTLRSALTVLLVGAVIAATYQVLAAFEVGGIGAPSDIGGGLIWLVGLVLIAAGLVMLALHRWGARDRRP